MQKRCHNCLRKITAENPASTVNRFGKECCDTCTLCEHGVPLINPDCSKCAALVAALPTSSGLGPEPTRNDIGSTVIDTRTGQFGEILQVWPLSRIADVAIQGTTWVTPVPFAHCC